MTKIWNARAIDYSKGTEIYDCLNGKVYTDSEARQQTKEIRARLCIRGFVIGCFVDDLETAKQWLKEKAR